MPRLSEWLELMLAEIARRQEEAQLNAEEEARRREAGVADTRATDASRNGAKAAELRQLRRAGR